MNEPLVSDRYREFWSPITNPDASEAWVPIDQADEFAGLVKAETPVLSGRLLRSYQVERDEVTGRAWMSSNTRYGFWIMQTGTKKIPATHRLSRIATALRAGGVDQARADAAERRKQREEDILGQLESDVQESVQFRLSKKLAAKTTTRQVAQFRRQLREQLVQSITGQQAPRSITVAGVRRNLRTAAIDRRLGSLLEGRLLRRVQRQELASSLAGVEQLVRGRRVG